ncbi:hypothetical protein [Azospirillum brasilense]|uniref:hypothetical protein n=1 Tax=Azospirillum brasilense TaxID=192 RepID=UPI001EDB80AE|nr:hypothetical protein [Azospirillum brasilense]UKJ74990.1 hypothetical protein H1Q64_21030 [Azospirillum brasilense]
MGVSGIGGYQQQPFTTPLSSGPAALQQTRGTDANQQAQKAEEDRRQQVQAQDQQALSSGGNTTPTRGQNLNITV